MLRIYDNRADLMADLAHRVAEELREAISERGHATIAVPGGTTPGPFFEALRSEDLDWQSVTILLTDERQVAETSDRSNTKLVKKTLLQEKAAQANFLNLLEASSPVEELLPLDIVVAGMGADMHTASIFPDAPQLLDLLSENASPVLTVSTPSGGEDRVTLTAPVLKTARTKHVLIIGPEKRAAYEQALMLKTESEAPIRVLLEGKPPATVHYTE